MLYNGSKHTLVLAANWNPSKDNDSWTVYFAEEHVTVYSDEKQFYMASIKDMVFCLLCQIKCTLCILQFFTLVIYKHSALRLWTIEVLFQTDNLLHCSVTMLHVAERIVRSIRVVAAPMASSAPVIIGSWCSAPLVGYQEGKYAIWLSEAWLSLRIRWISRRRLHRRRAAFSE